LLARIHRLTLGELRKAIQPVTAGQFMRWLLRWQHVAPGTQVLGERGVLEVVRQPFFADIVRGTFAKTP
jgi:ATP-dependent Lhr-like helicase